MKARKWLTGIVGIMVLTMGAGSVCSGEAAAPSEDFQKVVDEYAEITLRMDEESALADAAYASVEKYLEAPGLDQLEETAGEVEQAFRQFTEWYYNLPDYEMPLEISELIEDYDIYYEDFTVYASEEKAQISEYIYDLGNLYEYLGYEATDLPMTEEMSHYFDMIRQCQEIYRKYMYTGINYWFAGRSEAELAYVKEAVTDQLASFYSDGHEWDSNQANVEDILNAYLNEIEDLQLDWDAYLGEREAEVNKMKREQG